MKTKYFYLIFWSNLIFAQNKPYQFVVEQVSIASSGSRIEVRGKDTVLISDYNNTNLKSNVQGQLELVYKGTPYFQNGWYKGKVILSTNSKPALGVIAYDLVKNQVFFAYSNDKEAIEIKPVEFEINGHVFRKYSNQYIAAGNIYYEKLVEGETEIFKQYIAIYRPSSSVEKTGYEQSGDGYEGSFEKKVEYFINYHEKMQKVGKKYKIFDKNEKKAFEFAEKFDLNLSKPNDLIKIVRYLNGIEQIQ